MNQIDKLTAVKFKHKNMFEMHTQNVPKCCGSIVGSGVNVSPKALFTIYGALKMTI